MLPAVEALFLLSFTILAFAQNVTVTTQDSRMIFDGAWVVQDSGGHEFTTKIGSSVSLTFQGTAVYWHATMNPRCGIANITIDDDAGVLIDASQGTTTNTTPVPAILYATDGLQSGESHMINIAFFAIGKLGGGYLEMYNLSYTQDNTASSTSNARTGSSVDTGATHKDTRAIAGGVVGGVLGVLFVLGLGFLIFRRTKLEIPLTTPFNCVERSPNSGMSSKSPPISVFPRTPPLTPQSQSKKPRSPSSPPASTSNASTFGDPQTTVPSLPPTSDLSTSLLIPNRNEPSPSVLGDPPPPYIP